MPSVERLFDRGSWLGERRLREVGSEFRDKRLQLGLSQRRVADAARISRSTYCRVEHGKCPSLSVLAASRIGAVLGLDVAVKCYPGSSSIRDRGQSSRMQKILANVGRPLRYRTEVPLPRRADTAERRSWDLMLMGDGKRSGWEFETRLYDVQAQMRRHNLKRRDDPVDSFILVLANTRKNRAVLREYPDLFADLPLLSTATVLEMLGAGQHPPTGLLLL